MIPFKQRLFLIVFLLTIQIVYAQDTNKIKGKVFDENRMPLVGASVIIEGTNQGVSTNSEGEFEIECAPGATLVFSFIGYVSKNVEVQGRSYLEVTMNPQANILEEFVVVGYGKQKRANLTGAVSSVNYIKEADSRPVTSNAQILTGLSAGLMVSQP